MEGGDVKLYVFVDVFNLCLLLVVKLLLVTDYQLGLNSHLTADMPCMYMF